MYAIIANGSKQYKAEVGEIVKFEKLNGNVGDKVDLDVLMLSDGKDVKVGKDVEGVKAHGEIIEQGKDKKVVVYKYKAKKNERKKQGHRQPFTAVKITAIDGVSGEVKSAEKKTATKAATPKATAPKATAPKATATKTAAPKTAAKKPATAKKTEKVEE